ncbi:Bifunctional protein FolD, partial [Trichoplax sp. H2]
KTHLLVQDEVQGISSLAIDPVGHRGNESLELQTHLLVQDEVQGISSLANGPVGRRAIGPVGHRGNESLELQTHLLVQDEVQGISSLAFDPVGHRGRRSPSAAAIVWRARAYRQHLLLQVATNMEGQKMSGGEAQILRGDVVAKTIRQQLAEDVKNMTIKPGLAIVQVGSDEASNRYTKHKRKVAEEIGIRCDYINLPSTTSQDQARYTYR